MSKFDELIDDEIEQWYRNTCHSSIYQNAEISKNDIYYTIVNIGDYDTYFLRTTYFDGLGGQQYIDAIMTSFFSRNLSGSDNTIMYSNTTFEEMTIGKDFTNSPCNGSWFCNLQSSNRPQPFNS